MTDSKSVGSNTVRVRPPPSAPKIIPRSTSGVLFLVRREGEPATCGSCMDARWRSRKVGARTRRPQRPQFDNPATLSPAQQAGYYFWCGGRENPQLAGKAWMPYKMNAQSFARMRNQQSKHDVQGCTMAVHKVGARTRRPQRPQFDNPATLSPAQQAGYYFWCGGRENPQLAGKAWMPYKMNAQSFKQGCLKSAALSCHTMRQPKRLTRHDAKPTEQARRAKDAR